METVILTNSGSTMTVRQAQEYGIFLLPLQVIGEEYSYQDGVDINMEELCEALRRQHIPKTNMPTGSVIEAILRTIKEQGYGEIVSVPLSSGLLSTSNIIQVIVRGIGIPVIHIEDFATYNPQGHEALLAKRCTDEEKSGAEISKLLSKLVRTSGTLILLNDIQHLERGGRLTLLAAAAVSLLKIKPVLIIDLSTQGKIDVLEKVYTKKKAAAHAMDMISKKLAGREGYVYMIRPDCLEEAEDIHRQLLERNNRLETRINTISAIVAAYTGLDYIAIQYIEK